LAQTRVIGIKPTTNNKQPNSNSKQPIT